MKKIVYTLLSVFSTAALLVSCTTKPTDEVFTPILDTETECNIKMVGDYSNFEAMEKEFNRFNAYYPNVSLDYIKLDDYINTLLTVLEGHDKPNIFFSYTWFFDNEKYNPIIEHMENLSDPSLKFNLDCIRPGLISHDKDGNTLMIPIFTRSYGMLVNNDLFKKEGINIPNNWNELLKACDDFKAKDYKNPIMGYSLKVSSSSLMNTVAYPMFVAALADNPEALEKANNLDPSAGEYMRTALTTVSELVNKCIDLTECDKISDNYEKVILRFFEGDVPMMICAEDTPSGTKKRESKSEAYTAHPFEYTFNPIPLTADGGYFIDSSSRLLSVNKNCDNLDMTNEFMRFLISNKELNELAASKLLLTPTKEMSFDSIYAPFAKIPQNRTYSPEGLGVKDPLIVQIRNAAYKVGRSELTIQEAIDNYGKF